MLTFSSLERLGKRGLQCAQRQFGPSGDSSARILVSDNRVTCYLQLIGELLLRQPATASHMMKFILLYVSNGSIRGDVA